MVKHAKGSTRIYKEVQSMSKIYTKYTPTRRISEPPLQSLAFCTMGLGYCGPFPKAAKNKKYLLDDTDYFTNWVEAEPLANIRDVDVKKFVWKNIITCFGIPHPLISDNGLHFDSKSFKRYCCELGITNRYSTPAYP